MSQQNKAGLEAQGEARWNDNTNEEITPLRNRQMNQDYADSFAFLNDTNVFSGDSTFNSNINVPLTPTADTHAISKKYFDDNASAATGDVTGTSSSVVNEIPTYSDTTGKAIQDGSGVGLDSSGNFTSVGDITFSTATKTLGGIEVGNLLDKSASQTVSGGWTFSTNVTSIAPTTDLHLATKKYVDDNSGTGDVTKVGTPVNNQLGVWTGDGTIEGDANLTWDGSSFSIGGVLTANQLTVDNVIINSDVIFLNTSDTSDNERLGLAGGGSIASNRGGSILLHGNEYAGSEGDVDISAGDATSGKINFNTGSSLVTDISNTGIWDFKSNTLQGIGQATIDNIVLNGNDISTSSGDLTFNPTGDFLIQSGSITATASNSHSFGGSTFSRAGANVVSFNRTGAAGNALTFQFGGTTQGNIRVDTNLVILKATSGKSVQLGSNGQNDSLVIDSSENATFAGDIIKTGATEDVAIKDAGSTSATEQDWIEVTVGGVTGYIRVFATK